MASIGHVVQVTKSQGVVVSFYLSLDGCQSLKRTHYKPHMPLNRLLKHGQQKEYKQQWSCASKSMSKYTTRYHGA